jgi:hypothetical protein
MHILPGWHAVSLHRICCHASLWCGHVRPHRWWNLCPLPRRLPLPRHDVSPGGVLCGDIQLDPGGGVHGVPCRLCVLWHRHGRHGAVRPGDARSRRGGDVHGVPRGVRVSLHDQHCPISMPGQPNCFSLCTFRSPSLPPPCSPSCGLTSQAGYFSTGSQASCTACPSGHFCPSTTAATITVCAAGFYSLGARQACLQCPAGAACPSTDLDPVTCDVRPDPFVSPFQSIPLEAFFSSLL